MVNEEILTALRNAVDRGESLEQAVRIMINSKYNPAEVREAANYVSSGALQSLQPKPDEEFTMPTEKQGLFSRMFRRKKKPMQQEELSETPTQETTEQEMEEVSVHELPEPVVSEKPKKRSYFKEILLLILLMILAGLFVAVIIFRNQILGFLS
jgi:hypothetical protein